MADLLECVIQIKGLGETAPRLAAMVDQAPEDRWWIRPAPGVWAPIEVLGHLADLELMFGARLRAMLTVDQPALQRVDGARLAARARYLDWRVPEALARFRRRRDDNLELLETCSAAELGRVGLHPSRGPITVADMVAVMLAHDTDHTGQIRDRLGL
ncbi:MAG: DinB family protein [Acidobacteria bacterium]|nr:DinB family protein [Acidobacteriota bacterium]